jgi:hypothetical protein
VHLVQEPWAQKGKVLGLSGAGNIFFAKSTLRPRACVIVTHDLKAWPLESFCSEDVMAVEVSLTHGTVVYASVYMAHGSHCPPTILQDLLNYCKLKNLPILIGSDANAHHTMWGSSDVNERGEQLLEFIIENERHILNQGHQPTFVTAIRQERLDVSLVSTELINKVQSWRVDSDVSFSDHRYIKFCLKARIPAPVQYRNRKKTDWGQFNEHVRDEVNQMDTEEIISVNEIDQSVEKLSSILRHAYYKSCPLLTIKPTGKCVPWWTPELTDLRKEARRLQRRITLGVENQSLLAYKETKNKYKNLIQKLKRSSWKEFTSSVEKYTESCRMFRILNNSKQHILGRLQKSDGTLYASGIDLRVVTNQMQDVINTVSNWSKSVDLSVDQKVGLMLITNRRKYQTKTLILNGKKLEYMKQMKYLGITIDTSLTLVPHVRSKSAKALSALAQSRRAIGSKWGLSPRVTHWIYTAVVPPGVLYGSLVWAPATKFQNKTKKLQRVQSCALRTICGTMKSTPIVALEALLCMPSIDTKIQEHAVASMHRLKLKKLRNTGFLGHKWALRPN